MEYARSKDEVMDYLKSNYNIEMVLPHRVYMNDSYEGYEAEFTTGACACGETQVCYIDNMAGAIKKIAICESCWENNPDEQL